MLVLGFSVFRISFSLKKKKQNKLMKWYDCVSNAVDRFLEPCMRSAHVCDEWEQILHLIKTEGLKTTVFACTPCTVVSLSTTCVDFYAPPLTMEDSRAKSLKNPQKSNAEQTQTTPHMTHTTLHARRTPHIPHKFNQHVLWLITTLQKVNLIIFESFWEGPSSPSSPSHPAFLPKSSKNPRRNSNIRKS